MSETINNILEQMENNCNGYNEPQAWIELENGRSIEITNEQEGLPKEEYFYSLRLHCTEEEFDNDNFKSTIGVIDTYCTETISTEQLQEGIDCLILANNQVK